MKSGDLVLTINPKNSCAENTFKEWNYKTRLIALSFCSGLMRMPFVELVVSEFIEPVETNNREVNQIRMYFKLDIEYFEF